MPQPAQSEKEDGFVSRCMADRVMLRDYPNQSQRVAVPGPEGRAWPGERRRAGGLQTRGLLEPSWALPA